MGSCKETNIREGIIKGRLRDRLIRIYYKTDFKDGGRDYKSFRQLLEVRKEKEIEPSGECSPDHPFYTSDLQNYKI